jgi:histone acetyltransferase (RNA polymerase elongator complex component)
MQYKILPLFIPFIGCKTICSYCNQNTITGEQSVDILSNLKKQLSYYLEKHIQWTEVAIYGGTFTALNVETQEKLLNIISEKLPQLPIRISTRPDYINLDTLIFLKNFNVRTIELGIQSMSEKVLLSNNRFYTEDIILKSMHNVTTNNFTLGIQIMCGLFNEEIDDYIYTINSLKNENFNFIRIYPTIILKNTQLEKLFLERKYAPLSIGEAVSYCVYGFIKFTSSRKTVIRMGLQNSSSLEKSIVKGPHHKSFGDLVKIYLIYLYLLDHDQLIVGNNDKSLIYGYSGFIKNIFGHKIVLNDKDNIDWFKLCTTLDNEDNSRIFKEQKNTFEKKFFH